MVLADPAITAKVLRQGIMDIIINDQHCLWLFAYLTENSDLLMSAVDHLSYKDCKIHGKNGNIQVTFPTFSFNVKATENFESILWKPTESRKIKVITIPNQFQIKLLSPDSILPQQATVNSKGYDVASNSTLTIQPSSTALVPLGFSVSFDPSLKCNLRPRSSLSLKTLNVAFGTIDPNYRVKVKAIVTNNSDKLFAIHPRQRLGQLVFSPVSHPTPVCILYLDATKRGTQGFGSTGTSRLPSSKRRQVITSLFQPTLLTISEHPQKSRAPQRLIDPNTIMINEIEDITNQVTRYEVEDVTPPLSEKN